MSAEIAQSGDEPAYEQFERGDTVTLTYKNKKNGENVTHRGTVVKSNRGGTRILLDDVRRRPLRNVRLECGGHVIRNNREGNGWTKVVGDAAEISKTGETRKVRYKQHTGWLVDEN
jgi:hypothetical protein